jgi:cysteine synthase B
VTTAARRDAAAFERGARSEPALWGAVGETPLITVPAFQRGAVELRLKAEWLNPGGSVKDRAALFILRDGIARGELPGKRLLDSSSGNTAIAYAMLGAAAGIGVTVCVPANASAERKRLLAAYGAEVVFTDPLDGADGAILKARALAAARPDRYWYANQYGHAANPLAHYLTTAEELWRQTDGRITHFVAGLGTTGTMMGTGRRLKELKPGIELVAVQPDGPFHGLEGLKHLATAIVPRIYDPGVADRTECVATEAAEDAVRRLARSAGVFGGWSTGAALVAAERVAAACATSGRVALIVAVAPDSGERYLSERRRLSGERAGEDEGMAGTEGPAA